jgi:hypothetical protein
MNKNPHGPNRRPKLFLPLFLTGSDAVLVGAREPKPFPPSQDALRACGGRQDRLSRAA